MLIIVHYLDFHDLLVSWRAQFLLVVVIDLFRLYSVGYIIGLPVIGLTTQRFPLGRTCACLVMAWGLCVIMTVLCNNYAGIMVQRFFLGFIEAGIAPSFVSVIAMYYTKRERESYPSFSGKMRLLTLSIIYLRVRQRPSVLQSGLLVLRLPTWSALC